MSIRTYINISRQEECRCIDQADTPLPLVLVVLIRYHTIRPERHLSATSATGLEWLTVLGSVPYVGGVNGTDLMDTDQFYRLWEKYALSEIVDELPDNVEEICAKLEITVDYFIEEFI